MKNWFIYTQDESGRYRRGAGFASYTSAQSEFDRRRLNPESSCIAPR